MSGAERRLLPHEELKFVHYVARVVPFLFLCVYLISLASCVLVTFYYNCARMHEMFLCTVEGRDGRDLNMRVHRLTVQSSAQKGLVYHVTMNKLKNKLGTAA